MRRGAAPWVCGSMRAAARRVWGARLRLASHAMRLGLQLAFKCGATPLRVARLAAARHPRGGVQACRRLRRIAAWLLSQIVSADASMRLFWAKIPAARKPFACDSDAGTADAAEREGAQGGGVGGEGAEMQAPHRCPAM